jgi:hypothetical protein
MLRHQMLRHGRKRRILEEQRLRQFAKKPRKLMVELHDHHRIDAVALQRLRAVDLLQPELGKLRQNALQAV